MRSTISKTRADIDRDAIAFYGVSAGADAGVVLTALEPRLQASVLQGVGLSDEATPELDVLNYAPRVTVPTLMISGRYDFERPYETSQRPLFERLGTPAQHKRHVPLDAGHAPALADVAAAMLPWLDRYLGRPRRAIQ